MQTSLPHKGLSRIGGSKTIDELVAEAPDIAFPGSDIFQCEHIENCRKFGADNTCTGTKGGLKCPLHSGDSHHGCALAGTTPPPEE